MRYFIRPERGREDACGPVLGPFDEFVQLTYSELRVGPEGDWLAYQPFGDADWHFSADLDIPIADPSSMDGCTAEDWRSQGWSDLVIWAEAEA